MSLTLPVQVGPGNITINRDDRILVSAPDGGIEPDAEQGFFASDTRFVSAYGATLNGRRPVLLNSAPIRYFSVRHEFTNPALLDSDGSIPASTLGLRLDRTVAGGVHEDYDLVNYGVRPVVVVLELRIESDFADLFDVKGHQLVRRGTLQTRWFPRAGELRTSYRNRTFRPGLVVRVERASSRPQFANGRLTFVALIVPKDVWHVCIKWLPIIDIGERPTTLGCNALTEDRAGIVGPELPFVGLSTTNDGVRRAWEQAVRDMEALRLHDRLDSGGAVVPAAGVPWFVTLFGRDSLLTGMLGIGGYPEFAAGALRRLSELQATRHDPERDMEPGKILHEIRRGELTQLGLLPFAPYFGTHDATSLFVILVSYLYQWAGDEDVLRRYLSAVESAMRWIDHHGDRDGDGLQEYQTRSSRGYYNQGWKDAGDAIPHQDGALARLPLAVCELQGYAFDAKRRLADIFDVLGRPEDARLLRAEAERMYERINDSFWWEEEGTYYLALDGDKRPVRSVASNAGHLLAMGVVPPERAARVAARLLHDDMWSGWGIRTLSSDHPAYNPFSYHTGSVWPHDNAVIAGGFRRYGLDAQTAQVARGMFDAASHFVAHRLPELFAGLPRDEGAFPVQYLGANVPQAWAAAAVFRLIAVLCGIHAASDADSSRLYVHPALPEWLPELTISRLRVGRGSIDLHVSGSGYQVLRNDSGFEVISGGAPGRVPAGRPTLGPDG
ncbi:MAG: amylo-alpha-1,6-glucosidase [Chloroflexi bacterium]|nr:amylo-alpha-1,6-glucosidase [Chloroflexota bacterium]